MKKYWMTIVMIICLTLSISLPTANAATKISIFVNDKLQTYSSLATIEKGNTLVPLRGIFESLNANVTWNGKDRTIDASRGNQKIWLKIGSKTAKVNNKNVTLAAAPKIVNGNTLVPLRFVSESLGDAVKWDGATRSIVIGKSTLTEVLFKASRDEIKRFEQGTFIYGDIEDEQWIYAYDSKQYKLPSRLHYLFENEQLIMIRHNFLSGQEVYYGWNAMLQLFAEINENVEKVFGKATIHDRDDHRIISEWVVGKYQVVLQVDDYENDMTSAYLVIYPNE